MALNKRALGIAAAILLFTGLVTLQVVQTAKPRASQVVTLPDGSTLRLMEVSYGKEHFRPGSWWHPLARRLPTPWQSRLKMDTGASMTTSEPSLGVWLSWDKTGSGNSWWDFGLVDEHGVEVPANSNSNHGSSRTGQPEMLGRTFTAFPRRGSVVTLRFYERKPGGERVQAASFQFPNPVRDKFPEWRPQPVPAVVKQGDLEITFKQLLVGVNSDSKPGVARPGEEAWAWADFEVNERGVPSNVWFPDGIELTDATGNKVRQNSWSSGLNGSASYLRWRPFLWPSEAAWKIRVEFMRNERAVFSTNELIVVTGLVLPGPDEVTKVNLVTNRLGLEVCVFSLFNQLSSIRLNGQTNELRETELVLHLGAYPQAWFGKRLIVVSARDDLGRRLDSRGSGRSSNSYSFRYEPKPDAKSLDFTLAVQEVVTAEFLVQPEVFTPTKAAGK